MRALSARELHERLARRGVPGREIEDVVSSLRARGYLDDRALAYNVAASRANALFGRSRVAAELMRRGVERGTIAEAVARAFADHDEDDLACRAAIKLLGSRSSPDSERARVRLARSLLRRGFSRGAVRKALVSVMGAAAVENDDDELETDA